MLDASKRMCVEIHEAIRDYVVPFGLPEPAEDDVALVRAHIETAST